MSRTDTLNWAMPVMRAGYAGRGLVYVAIAGFSLWAIWQGGSAKGTQSALSTLEATTGGSIVLIVIAIGLFAYFLWRVLDAVFDFEAYGTDAEGVVARGGMLVTGLVHAGLAVAALGALSGGGGEGGSSIERMVSQVMSLPAGRMLVGVAGLLTIGAGIYYLLKAWREDYRETLRANRVTTHWNFALKAGVAAQGVIVTILGGFLSYAAWRYEAGEAGGLGQVFAWLATQPFGNVLVVLVCLGLLGFALFCFVNAAYRIIPKLADPDIKTLASALDG